MSRDVFTKLLVVVVIVGLAHGIFWFFKAGQIEKNINNFVSSNSANISVGEIEVSGFPFSQKVSVKDLKFTLPHSSINRYQISIRELEATSGIFGSDFQVSLKEQVAVQDSESSISGYVEFTSQPEINFTISDGAFEKLTYKDSGYKVLDAEKNIIFATSSAQINFESSVQDDGKVKNTITADVKEIEGFDIISVYKNSSERKIIDGIKTGEVSIGSSVTIPSQPSDGTDEAVAAPSAAISPNKVVLDSNSTSPDSSVKTAVETNPANPTASTTPEVSGSASNNPAAVTDSSQAQAPANNDALTVPADNSIKSNFTMNIEYELVPNSSDQSQNLSDPTQQVQENVVQYSKVVNIKTLEFSNSLYKISINGQMNIFQDDTYPSGSVSVKVENLDNLLSHLSNGLTQIAEQKKPETEIQSSDLSVVDGVTASNPSIADNNTAFADPYQNFLQKLVAGLPAITKEVAKKNQLSDPISATFDIRREKNIEFLVNETPLREILGKF
ncbi:MAG: hypothetical protein FJ368_01375 [Pelagibacterales bacterium]|nr:hypothetical protein [Pelagibacterales bacterium]